jgi:hypothetical protein
VPIIGDPAVFNHHVVGGDELDRLSFALCLAELALENGR